MIKSPWEQATALVTTEREGIRTHRRFALESSQQAITVPLTEADIPNVFVSVLLVKGRSVERHAGRRQRSGQAVVPPRLRAARGRGREQAAPGDGEGRQGRVPSGQHGARDRDGQGPRRHAGDERSHAVGGRLRRAVADRLPDARRPEVRLRAQGAPGADDRQPPAHRQPPRAHAEGRRRGRRRRRGAGCRHDAEGLPRAGVLDRIGRDRRQRPRHAWT